MLDPEVRPRRVAAAALVAALVVAAAVACAFAMLRAWQLPAGGETGSAALVASIPEPRLQSAPQLEQHLGARVPAGWPELVGGDRPVVLLPAYYRCDMLCGTAAHGALEALADTGLPPDRWRLVLLSADPQDTPAEAARLRRVYLDYARFARPERFAKREPDLQLLTGGDAVARTVGFAFRPKPDRAFAHPTALVVLTPEGTVSRYLPGVRYDPPALRAALVEASQGRIGTLADRLLVACSHFIPSGRDALVMAGIRAIALAALAGIAVWLWRRCA